jgi:hypothetical protein
MEIGSDDRHVPAVAHELASELEVARSTAVRGQQRELVDPQHAGRLWPAARHGRCELGLH